MHIFIPSLFKHILQLNLYIYKAACPSVSLWVTHVFVSHTRVGALPSAQVMGNKHKHEILATLLLTPPQNTPMADTGEYRKNDIRNYLLPQVREGADRAGVEGL